LEQYHASLRDVIDDGELASASLDIAAAAAAAAAVALSATTAAHFYA